MKVMNICGHVIFVMRTSLPLRSCGCGKSAPATSPPDTTVCRPASSTKSGKLYRSPQHLICQVTSPLEWTCIHCSKGLYLLKASKGKRVSKLILTCAARKKPLGRIGSRGNALCLSMFARSRFVQRNVRTQSMLPPKAKVKKLLEPLAMLSTLQTRRASGPNGFSPAKHVMFEIRGCWCDICAIRKTEPLI